MASRWVLQRDERGRPESSWRSTRRHRAKRAEEKFRGLLESAPDAMVIVDQAGRIVLVNSQTEASSATPPGAAGAEPRGPGARAFRGAHAGTAAATSRAPRVRPMGEGRELYGLRKDGSEFPVEISLSPLETEEGVLVSSAIRDVTERKRVEEVLRQRTAQLEAANKELEAFSYSVSHDLRAPCGRSTASRASCSRSTPNGCPTTPRTTCNRCAATRSRWAGWWTTCSPSRAWAVSRSRSRPSIPPKLVQQCLDELRGERDGRRIEIIMGDLPPCDAEPALLKQVWINLLSNAIKYTRGREVATIEIGCRVDGDPPGEPTYFVRDNGVGFDMRYADKLFGVFQRLHRAEDYEGTGVGLAIVQRIVHRHGGRVWAEARPGQGATFYFTLGEGLSDD